MEEGIPGQVRRQRMLSLVREREFVRVADLSSTFGISEVTVRADLASLAAEGLLRRVHGGAMAPEGTQRVERTFEEALDEGSSEKEAIGHHVAAGIGPGATVILDVGTSTAAIARALVTRHELTEVTVFTSSLTIALDLEPAIPRVRVVVTGGTLRPKQHSLVDPMSGFVLDNIHADTAYLGCNGVHPEFGVTNINLPEAAVKRKMMAAAHRVVVVADGSKVGNTSVAKIADLADIDQLVTGPSAPPQVVADIESRGLSVAIAEPALRA